MRFFVVGDVSVDLIYFLERIPEPGEEVPAQRALMKPGGAGGTLAAHLASLGNKVYLASRVGNDPFRSVALSELEKVNVDLKYLQVDLEQTTSSILILLIPGGERSMISAGGASRYLDAAEFKARMLDQVDAVVFSAYAFVGGPQKQYAINALDAARKRELPIFVDLGTGAVRAAGKELLDILRGVPYLLMNQVELLALTGTASISDGVNELKGWGLETVVVKVGAMGSIVITPTRQELIEPYPLEEVVDTTGSGDAFTATFAHAILQGKDPFVAARLGNLAGSLAATAVGGQGRLITEKDLLQAR
ncbi:carbohydrate kinase family protein [Meiothermus sp.]|uniref:carbohydrate kinase family protein n=1 Tax=Meiothermus sp. TaxID=1955249 RepID=UPI0021DDA046|nr:carbohydrate kinase family protein [Meiothermus sp.]GIW34908.1 MAG: sugar kinase [Meiothermus sp.]